jgi:hypothetical protein
MEDGITLVAWINVGGDSVTAYLPECPEPMEPIGEKIGLLIKIDFDRRELDTLLVGLGIFSNHRIVQ